MQTLSHSFILTTLAIAIATFKYSCLYVAMDIGMTDHEVPVVFCCTWYTYIDICVCG